MTAAVLDSRAGIRIGKHGMYLSTVGGMRLTDPSSNLAVALASPRPTIRPACHDGGAIGEVGLAGDLRRVTRHGAAAGRNRPTGIHHRAWSRWVAVAGSARHGKSPPSRSLRHPAQRSPCGQVHAARGQTAGLRPDLKSGGQVSAGHRHRPQWLVVTPPHRSDPAGPSAAWPQHGHFARRPGAHPAQPHRRADRLGYDAPSGHLRRRLRTGRRYAQPGCEAVEDGRRGGAVHQRRPHPRANVSSCRTPPSPPTGPAPGTGRPNAPPSRPAIR